MALMQHFGAPTRLLDFTKSPYVAAYFAFEELPPEGCDECSIWVLNPYEIRRRVGQIALVKGMFDRTPEVVKIFADAALAAGEDAPTNETPADYAGGLVATDIERFAGSHIQPMVSVFEPQRLSARMAAQQGVFLWSGCVAASTLANLQALTPIDFVQQITVPCTERGRALDQLRLMNITRASLFPGLEGFAMSLRQASIRESRESMQTRRDGSGTE